MIAENNKEKIKKNFKLILSILAIIIFCAFLLFFNQPKKNESDIAKIINSRNKIILQACTTLYNRVKNKNNTHIKDYRSSCPITPQRSSTQKG